MSVVVKDLAMPKRCASCPFIHSIRTDDKWVAVCVARVGLYLGDNEQVASGRHPSCPLTRSI